MLHDQLSFVPAKRLNWASLLVLLLALLVLASCSRRPAPTRSPNSPNQLDNLPENNSATLIRPEVGGVVGLRDGAEIALPRQSLTDSTLVTLRGLTEDPPAPVPSSIIGRPYEISLEGGDLTGIAMLNLPVPAQVTPDQYELAAYRWDGSGWQRVNGKYGSQGIRVGINSPGTYAVLGNWRMADSTLGLTIPPGTSARDVVPVEARGEYRYSAVPTTQHDYVEARLTLKRDSSGGAGQVSGIDQMDETVAETVLFFKPDPSQSQGVVDFNYTFQVDPATLNVPLGSNTRFYATLNVADSPAPTRRLSTGVDYTVLVPIKATGTDVLRPEIPGGQQQLFWHVRLNGQTLFRRPATGVNLPLAEALAQGGLGEYKITLDAENQGQYMPVSNEVTVQLKVPGVDTPAAIAAANGGSGTPTPYPFGPMPPTPTRRAPPNGAPSSLEGPTPPFTATLQAAAVTPTPSITPTPTRINGTSTFWADQDVVGPGECTILHWNVENVREVYIGNTATTGVSTVRECPTRTSSYKLRVVDQQGKNVEYTVTVQVQGTGDTSDVVFTVDDYQIVQNNCTTLRWRATGVTAVYLNNTGVGGESTQQICPQSTATYRLKVVGPDGETTRSLTVWVLPANTIPIQFWADGYTLAANSCTMLHWSVENVDEVHLRVSGTESGVQGNGSKEICPKGSVTYVLTASSGSHTTSKTVVVQSGNVDVKSDEVIAQGLVYDVAEVADIDPNQGGDQAGWRITVDGVSPIEKGFDSCCQDTMNLYLAKAITSQPYPAGLDWPVQAGQQIEFRLGPCTATDCRVSLARPTLYLRPRSP